MASSRNSKPPVDLLGRASECLALHVRPGARLAAALSGGVDSVLLLHVLRKLAERHGFHLSALHVNHGLSANADQWQAFCEQLCKTWEIPLEVRRVDVKLEGDGGLEAAARQARYDAFVKADAEFLVLAHHQDDQAETLLFNLLRGAGVGGAAGMPVFRTFPGRPGLGILRPLLEVPREEILACAQTENLTWVEDESNSDERHARNFLRHRIFPPLRDRFPGGMTSLARAASHFAESERLLADLARIDGEKAMRHGRVIASQLAQMDDARARNLMRHVLRSEGIRLPDSVRMQELVRQVCHAAPDRQLGFYLGCRMLHRYRDQVWLIRRGVAGSEMEWRGEEELKWGSAVIHFNNNSTSEGISRERLAGGRVRIAPRRGGEFIRPDGRRPRRALKKLLQEHAVPPWERDILPLLWCGDDLVWVAGIGIDAAWQCQPGEPGVVPEYENLLLV